jgi:Ca2+-transporting ATPase
VERDLVYLGLSGMYDPPRPEARDAITQCRSAGIRVVMITGDHPKTAIAIARELGIEPGPAPVTGAELDRLSETDLRQRSGTVTVYARVTAEHKLRIVRALRAGGAVVAMTGDGVNDAPALQGSDIGIALGRSGTEVTKQAADMVITDDNFATIVAAVQEGRGTYDNIRKTLQYLLAGNTGELLLVTGCVLVGMPMPLLPIHLLWINLLTDGLPAMCLVTDPVDPGVMQRQPRPRSARIANHPFLRMMFLTGFLTAGVAMATYAWVLHTGTLEQARAAAFAVLVYAELLRSFGVRSATLPVWRIPLLTNVSLLVVVLVSFALQVFSQQNDTLGRLLKTAPVPFGVGLLYLAIGAIPLLVLELLKILRKPQPTTTPILPSHTVLPP